MEQSRNATLRGPSDEPPRPKKKKHGFIRRFFFLLGTLLLVILITGSFLGCFAAVYIQNVIQPQADMDVADYPMNLSSTIYCVDPDTGETIEYETLHGDQNRVWVAYDQIPQNLIHAAVAIEDRRFYEHHGVDWLRTAKSVFTMFTGGKMQGGSTITQQLIKNLTTYDDVTVKRKILEIFRALEFDKKYSKSQTLEWYLNYIYFGRRCYGVYTASYAYFGKNVSELSLAECASLISITNNPSKYDPYNHPDNNQDRRNAVLEAMCDEGYISASERDQAKAEVLQFQSADFDNKSGKVYSWYTEQVITDVMNDLQRVYGYSDTVARDLVYSGGLEIYASVNTKIQAIVDSVYSDVSNLPYKSASGQQLQSAITIVDPMGNVVGLSGKIGVKNAKDTRGWNRATRSLRQPGSTIKPIAVYAPAIEMGLITPYSVLEDSPPMEVNGKAWPSNVDHRYTGQMTVTKAVTNSTNTVAVRVLQQVTPEVAYEYLIDKFGVDSNHLVDSRVINGTEYTDIAYSPMALGGLTEGVSTLDMAGAYAVFPRHGVYIKPHTYSRVVDSKGKEILSSDTTGQSVLKEKTTYYVNELLKDVLTEGSGKLAAFSGMTIAGKTGSTDSNNDRWFVGYTPYYTAAVWTGYDNPERVRATGNPAAVLWRQVMSQVHEGLEYAEFATPDGLEQVYYCLDSGKKASNLCSADVRGHRVASGYLFPEDVPAEYCDAHVAVEVCTASPVYSENGSKTGRYHLATKYCPRAGSGSGGRATLAVLSLEREYIGGVVPEDNGYLIGSYRSVGYCTVHGSGGSTTQKPKRYDPSKFNINDQSTWPSEQDYPNFDPDDPSTWPNAGTTTATSKPVQTPASSQTPPESHIPTSAVPSAAASSVPISSEVPSTPVSTEAPPPQQTVTPTEPPATAPPPTIPPTPVPTARAPEPTPVPPPPVHHNEEPPLETEPMLPPGTGI